MTVATMPLVDLLRDIVAVPASMADVRVSGLSLDSRRVAEGEGFVALAGAHGHGLDHLDQVVSQGATCVLYEPPLPDGVAHAEAVLPMLAVSGLRAHLGMMAERAYDAPSKALRIAGVTGTNGKTSTVHLLAQALAAADVPVATIGTLGAGRPGALVEGERTTPDVLAVHALLRRFVDAGVSHVAMEVSSHALDQGRVERVQFAVAVFTNLSRDHLDYHGDMQAYGAAKARLFSWPGLQSAVVNTDDAFGVQLADRIPAGVRVLRCGERALEDGSLPAFHARNVRAGHDGLQFTLVTPDGEALISTRLLGRFNVANLLAVAATLHALGWTLTQTAQVLPRLDSVPGRMSRLGGDGRPLVVVDYAHTPDALEQALASLREHTVGRVLCVFGCGGERDRGKRPQMAAIAEAGADRVTVTDDNPRSEDGDAIVSEILAGFRDPSAVVVQRDRAEAIRAAIVAARAGDTVLIAGKGHEAYQEIAGRRLAFDDREQATRALEGWSC
jgi:UDP-N-acetylmuramoyl-L-alanyl-D-glutamate--2,6-diaminopimelate ligase